MSVKICKRIAVVFLVMCYCCGQMLFPINAEDGGFDELLAERQDASQKESTEIPPQKEVRITDFADVREDDWFYSYLDYLVSNRLINGKTPDSFEPTGSFSYAECSAVIVRYLGLEGEASKRQQMLSQSTPEMKNIWYAGYFDIMSELGIFDGYGLFESNGGKIIKINTDAANSPISRYRFAECISRSFELDSTLRAQNVLYAEMGGQGREFIVGGGYRDEVLTEYQTRICDYESIPEGSRQSVLKAYYNGIFCGDISGNFYPMNNLTRAEMAKVLATVMDFALRTRLVETGYGQRVDDNMLHTDAVGEKTLDFDVWQRLLFDEAEGITVDKDSISYKAKYLAPSGYAVDAYLYRKHKDGYELVCENSLRDGNDGGFTYESDDARILLVVRNVLENSRPEGVVNVTIRDGGIVDISPMVS